MDHTQSNNSAIGGTGKGKSTKGWKLLIEWCDGMSSWVLLKDMVVSNPVECAEYAQNNGRLDEPAFSGWAKRVLNKRKHIISRVKSCYWKTDEKFGQKL